MFTPCSEILTSCEEHELDVYFFVKQVNSKSEIIHVDYGYMMIFMVNFSHVSQV